MPTYDYVCGACGHELEIFQSMSEGAKRKCPECGKLKLERQIGAGAGFLFKGDGYYVTDYRSEGYQKDKQADSKPKSDSSSSDGKDSSKKPSAAKKPSTEKKSPDKKSGGDGKQPG